MSFTVKVTYTGSQSTTPGLTFDTEVYTGAIEAGGASGNKGQTSGSTCTVSITPNGTNSLIAWSGGDYSSNTDSMSAATNNTKYESWVSGQNSNAGVFFGHYSGTVTAGTPVSAGFTGTSSDELGIAAYEIQASGASTPVKDASSPAQVDSQAGKTGTTASFNPPAGSVIVLLINLGATNSSGTVSCSISDTSGLGLVWTQQATESHSGSAGIDGYQTIFTTTIPAPATTSFSSALPATPSPAWSNQFGTLSKAGKNTVLFDTRPQFSGSYLTAGDITFGATSRGSQVIPVTDPPIAQPGPAWQNVFNVGPYPPRRKHNVLFDAEPASFFGNYLTAGDIAFSAITTGVFALGLNDPDIALTSPAWQNRFAGSLSKNTVLWDRFLQITATASGSVAFGAVTLGSASFSAIATPLAAPGPAWLNQFAQASLTKYPVYFDGTVAPPTLGVACFNATEQDENTFGGTATEQNFYGGSYADSNLYGGTLTGACSPSTVNIVLNEFNDEILSLTILNNGSAFSLNGWGLQALFKTAAGQPDSSAMIFSVENGAIVITSISGGLATLTIPNSVLQNTNFGFWRLDAIAPTGSQFTVMCGIVTVSAR